MDKEIKILLVDDESDFTKPMAYWLKSKGYTVSTVYDGESAIKLVQESPPDIMFLDIHMPFMNGADTLKKIREFNKELPVIIISGFLEDEKAREATTYGVSGVFYKGSDFNEGLTLLETVLRTHKNLKNK
jgi:DNA-binding response OmpR family regulator